MENKMDYATSTQNIDYPITINVGGDSFMTTLATVQTLPNTLLTNLANSLYLNTDRNPKGFLNDVSEETSMKTNPSYTSRFIHIISINESETYQRRKPTTLHHGPMPNSLCSKYSSATSASMTPKYELFVDRNSILMPYIIDLYRTGQLHLPSNVCSPVIRSEMKFWGISEDLISACCWRKFDEGFGNLRIIDKIKKSLFNPYDSKDTLNSLSGMAKVWITMERPSYSLAATIWCSIYFGFILVSMVVFSIGSLPDHRRINPAFKNIRDDIIYSNKSVSLIRMMSFTAQIEPIGITNNIIDAFFSIEFLIRLITCPNKNFFLRSGHNIVDIIILLIAWLNFLVETGFANNPDSYGEFESHINVVLSCCVVVRVLRVCHVAKHMPAMKLMYLSTRESVAELLLLIAVVGSAILMMGTAMFLVETFDKLPGDMGMFRHVPYAMWWAVVTMTTVGYGDFYPTTAAGYLVGTICAMSGLLLLAMPIAVIATNFSDYYYNMTSRDQLIKNEEYVKVNGLGHPNWNTAIDGNNLEENSENDATVKIGKDNPLKIEDLEASYGDFYPTTAAGYLVGTICAMSGLLLLAMPIAVIATNFSDYYYNMTSRDQLIKNEEYVKVNGLGHPNWNTAIDGNNLEENSENDATVKIGKDNPLKIEDLEAS